MTLCSNHTLTVYFFKKIVQFVSGGESIVEKTTIDFQVSFSAGGLRIIRSDSSTTSYFEISGDVELSITQIISTHSRQNLWNIRFFEETLFVLTVIIDLSCI